MAAPGEVPAPMWPPGSEADRLLSPPCAEPGGPQPALLTDEMRAAKNHELARAYRSARLNILAEQTFYDDQRYAVRDELVLLTRLLEKDLELAEAEVARLEAAMPTRQCMVCEDDVRVDELTAGVCDDCTHRG